MSNLSIGSNAIQRIVRNAVSILSSNVLIKATTFVIYALVARYAGAHEFGQISLALSLLYTFHRFATAGIRTLTIREVAKDHDLAYKYLFNGSTVVVVASALSVAALVILMQLMDYSADTNRIIWALFIGLLPYALSQLCESVFQAWEKMQFIAYVNGPMHIAKAIAAYLLLGNSFGVLNVAYAIAAMYWCILIIEWILLIRMKGSSDGKLDFGFMQRMVRQASTFLGIEGILAINSSIGLLILSRLLTEEDVGIYSSALQVTVPLSIIINDVVRTVFPIMCRKYEDGTADLRWVVERLLEVLIVLILPAIVGISLLADKVLLLLYQNNEFLGATFLLRLLVWWSLVNAVTTVLGQVLWASQREKQSLYIAITALVANFVGSLIFIRLFGLNGVVFTAVVVAAITMIQHYIPVAELLKDAQLLPILWKPAISAAFMAGTLVMSGLDALIPAVIVGACVYLSVLALLYIWSFGGVHQTRVKYRQLRFGT